MGAAPVHGPAIAAEVMLAAEEQAVLDAVFQGKSGRESSVTFSTAQSRLFKHRSAFASLVRQDLDERGLFDRERMAVRRQYLWLSSGVLSSSRCS